MVLSSGLINEHDYTWHLDTLWSSENTHILGRAAFNIKLSASQGLRSDMNLSFSGETKQTLTQCVTELYTTRGVRAR